MFGKQNLAVQHFGNDLPIKKLVYKYVVVSLSRLQYTKHFCKRYSALCIRCCKQFCSAGHQMFCEMYMLLGCDSLAKLRFSLLLNGEH